MENINLILNVNGNNYQVNVGINEPLLWVLRDNLNLTGTKFGCGNGVCGTCSVLIDGIARRSCRIPVAYVAAGQEILTIEGLETDQGLHPIQEAFIEKGAIQFGFCTSGVILSARSLLDRHPNPREYEIRLAISGNLCRCTGYQKITEAVRSAGESGK